MVIFSPVGLPFLEYKCWALSVTVVLIAEIRSSYLLPVATDKEALTNHFHVCSASIAKLHFIEYYKHHPIAILHLHVYPTIYSGGC